MIETVDAEEDGRTSSPRTAPRASARDRTATVLLMVAFVVLVPILSLTGLLLVMASDGCGVAPCRESLIGTGVVVATGAPVLVFLVALGWTMVRWRRGRSTWWVPLLGVAVGAALWGGGAAITFSGVG